MEGDPQPSSRPPSANMSSALEKLDVSTIAPESVLSSEEIQLLTYKFSLCNTSNGNKVRAPLARLTSARACKLFREDYPSLSEWEIRAVFQKYDVNGDSHLSFMEYLQTRAYYRMLLEENTQLELLRIFSILDTDSDGLLLADDVLHRIERTGLHGVSVLKQVITQAAEATKVAEKTNQFYCHREGEITFEHFSATIQDVNRKMEQGIATKILRVIDLQKQLQQHQLLQSPPSGLDHKAAAYQIEIEVLNHEIKRLKKELITDNKNALGEACEMLMSTYENEQHVYECISSFIKYCSLNDATPFRHNLEREGKRVNILNSMLLAPPDHLKKTVEYRRMMNLSLNHESPKPSTDKPSDPDHGKSDRDPGQPVRPHASDAMLETLLMNPTLRKQFAYYAMTGNVTNLVWITLSNFIKFVKDCRLNQLPTPALQDVDISNIFAAASRTGKALNFEQWLSACIMILQRSQPSETISDTEVQALVETHIIPRAKMIHVQQLAPDISQNHVMKLVKEHIWQFKQIFSHFGIQSLVEVDSKVRLDMKEFLTFARAFNIIRSPTERSGEPLNPSYLPATGSASIAPITLVELVREYYAAKLDISIAHAERREAADLNFREFLRCIQRISLAMHVHRAKRETTRGVTTTVFEATKDDATTVSTESTAWELVDRHIANENVQTHHNFRHFSPSSNITGNGNMPSPDTL